MKYRAGSSSASSGGPIKVRIGVVVLAVTLVGLLCVIPAAASAAITHNPKPFSPLDGSGAGQPLTEPQGIAIDEATGNVFVTNNDRISILGAEGAAPVGLAAPYEIQGIRYGENSQASIAFDNSQGNPSRGTLYTYDQAAEAVKAYARNATSEAYEEVNDSEIADPGAQSVELTVDTAGNLYVSNYYGAFGPPSVVLKYNPAQTLVGEYAIGVSSAKVSGEAVVDSAGDLFVADQNRGLFKFTLTGSDEFEPDNYTRLTTKGAHGVAIDPSTGHVFAALTGNTVHEGSVGEFDATSGSLIDEFGLGLVNGPGQLAVGSSTERIYSTNNGTQGSALVNVFGAAVIVPTLTLEPASEVTGTEARLNGTINPEGIPVTGCVFEWGKDLNGAPNYEHQIACEPPPTTNAAIQPVSATIAGLQSNGAVYHFHLVAKNANGTEITVDRTLVTASTAVSEPASAITPVSATLNGSVRPEGLPIASCKFEYGLTTSHEFEHDVPCVPAANEIPANFDSHPVTAEATDLQANAIYRFRLVAVTGAGPVEGKTLTFSTVGSPLIKEIRARDAAQTSVTLEATVDPRGFATSYQFEWGLTASYGTTTGVGSIEAGGGTTKAVTALSGLQAGTAYHYRIAATNGEGRITRSPDQLFETLNSCGLFESRCYELVSPPDVGPVDLPGAFGGTIELHFQAANRPGALAYVSEAGLPSATKGAEVLSKAELGPAGWASFQLSPELKRFNETTEGSSASSSQLFLNEELTCGVLASNQALTGDRDPGAIATLEAGGVVLYRQNPDGTYTALTTEVPTNVAAAGAGSVPTAFKVEAASQNCEKIVFTTSYSYPEAPTAEFTGLGNLYEWEGGDLQAVGHVPGASGEVLVPAEGAKPENSPNNTNAVSANGERVFFTAAREESQNPEEVGFTGIFVRERGEATRDVSLSETGVPDRRPVYDFASKDGSRVYFTAAAGLTNNSSSEGRDLYVYDLEHETLTDLTPSEEVGGAAVAGLIGSSDDGSRVYFVAQGQLVPGRGPSLEENQLNGTYSIFGEYEGRFEYAGLLENDTLQHAVTGSAQTARVSADGQYLLFESTADVTGFEGANESGEGYLYDASAPSEPTVCISCRSDGEDSVSPPGSTSLASNLNPINAPYAPRSLVVREGRPIVFFTSKDSLAAGATERAHNAYEWTHGQVFLLTAEPSLNAPPVSELGIQQPVQFAGASGDGNDVYFATPQTLSWEDGDERGSIYDARVGGGHPAPPSLAGPCRASEEGACAGPVVSAPAVPLSASQGFTGPGNKKHKHKHTKHKKHKHNSHKNHKHKKHKHKNQGRKKKKRNANGNRRTGK